MSIHSEFLAGSPRCTHSDALAGGVQFIAKEILKGKREPNQAAKDILKMVDEYLDGRTKIDSQDYSVKKTVDLPKVIVYNIFIRHLFLPFIVTYGGQAWTK